MALTTEQSRAVEKAVRLTTKVREAQSAVAAQIATRDAAIENALGTKVSQVALAAATGLSRAMLNKILAGRKAARR